MYEVSLTGPNSVTPAYLRVPDGAGPWPGVVVLHDALGQTDASRAQADWLAGTGFLTVAPDLFSRGNKFLCLRAVARQMAARRGAAFEDIELARSTLASRDDCTGRIGVIGFCLGGAFALLSATRPGFSASSVNYGPVPPDAARLLEGACPVIGSFGGRDYTLKGAAAQLESALLSNGVDHDVKEYPDAGHAFLEAHGGALGWVMARIGMGFHGASTADARERILNFFDRHLR